MQLYASVTLAYSRSSVLFSLVGQSTNCERALGVQIEVVEIGDENKSRCLVMVAEWMTFHPVIAWPMEECQLQWQSHVRTL